MILALTLLTDRPKVFCDYTNVISIKHNVQSVGIFHDKLCCVERCLIDYSCCIYVDAACRLLGNIAMSRDWKPGLTAMTCWNLGGFLNPKKGIKAKSDLRRKLAYDIAEKFNIPIDQCKFIYEAAFCVQKSNEKELEFVAIWKQIRDYFEFNGIVYGEGVAMGLAARKVFLDIHHFKSGYMKDKYDMDATYPYKDKLFYKLLIHGEMGNIPENVCKNY